jgi:LPXTG-site transpeptidase (sortase) family protein
MTNLSSHFTKLKLMSLVGGILLVIGLIGVSPTLYFRWSNSGTANASAVNFNNVVAQVNTAQKPVIQEKLITGFPVSISIPGSRPALDINVSVNPGYYNKTTAEWTLSESAAQFAVISNQPNNISGNTFIYGHYRANVFAYLHLIKPGTIATVTTNNGYQFNYKFLSTYAVQPTDTNVLAYSGTPILTVQTCSGSFFQNRQMFIFSYLGFTKTST